MLLIAGCGSEVAVDNAAWRGLPEVAGTVTLDGSPLTDATVSFHSARQTLIATTDKAGRFTLELKGAGESAIGKYVVRIQAPAASESEAGKDVIVPSKYNVKSELVVDIFDGRNDFDFRLHGSDSEDTIEE